MKVFILGSASDKLKELALQSNIDLHSAGADARFFFRALDQNVLELVDRNKNSKDFKNNGSILIDFIQDKRHYQRKALRGKNELMAKALGLKLGFNRVLDLTAGLAQDSVFMRCLGFEVEACERNPWIYLMLAMAHQKALESREHLELFKNIRFYFYDGKEILEKFSGNKDKTAVYIDPMYPEKKKDALPRKEMQIFRDLVGEDEDSEILVDLALKQGYQRVVVKRPLKAPPLRLGPQHSFKGKAVRFDLYLGKAKGIVK